MKPKTIISITVISLIVIFAVYQQITIQSLRKQIKPDNTAILEANIVELESENDRLKQDADFYKQINEELLASHNENNYQKPTDNSGVVDEFVDFVPDYYEFPINETRFALTNYKWVDEANDYRMNLEITYRYKTGIFEIKPSELSYEAPKTYSLTTSVLIASNGYGIMLEKDLWRFNVGVGGLVTKEIEGIALIKVGFRW